MHKGRLILVGGGARSGKSDFALALARRLGPRRLFLATAQALDEEMRVRIDRHRATRGGDFRTLEEPFAVPDALRSHADCEVCVLDCLTLWLSNLLVRGDEPTAILQQVESLVKACEEGPTATVVITNEVGLGLVPETPLGRAFRDVAGLAHQRLSRAADDVYFGVLGTMLQVKPVLRYMEAP